MKVKKFSVIVLFVIVLTSGCSSTESKVMNAFKQNKVFDFFGMKFSDIIKNNYNNFFSYEIHDDNKNRNNCINPNTKIYDSLLTKQGIEGLELNISNPAYLCAVPENERYNMNYDLNYGTYKVSISNNDEIIVNGNIDETTKKMFSSFPLLSEGLVLNTQYINEHLILEKKETRYLDQLFYKIKDPNRDNNNIYLKYKLDVEQDFTQVVLKFDSKNEHFKIGFLTEDGLSVSFEFMG